MYNNYEPFLHHPNIEPSSGPLHDVIRHVSPHNSIPKREKRLRVVILNAVNLVVNIVISAVILEQNVEQVPRNPKTADRLRS